MTDSRVAEPTTATVAAATSYGTPEVLTVLEREVAPPGPGEVTIDVRAIGTNPIDHKIVSGAFGTDPARLPLVPGSELSGVVAAVGPGAQGPLGPLAVGDEVIAYPVSGAYASRLTVRASSVLPKPASVSFELAAGILAVGVTAAHLMASAGVAAGETVLVHGVAGSVGLVAAQLALQAGATVVGTAAERRHADLAALGIVPVTYGAGLADRVRSVAPQGVDVALDTIGTREAVDVSWELLADRDRLVSIAAFDRADEGVRLLGAGPGADPGTEVRAAARPGIVEGFASGGLTLPVVRTFPLSDAAEALEFVRGGHAGGKVVLVP